MACCWRILLSVGLMRDSKKEKLQYGMRCAEQVAVRYNSMVIYGWGLKH